MTCSKDMDQPAVEDRRREPRSRRSDRRQLRRLDGIQGGPDGGQVLSKYVRSVVHGESIGSVERETPVEPRRSGSERASPSRIASPCWRTSETHQPPSTTSSAPVTNREAGSQRYSAASATSSADPGPAAIGCLDARYVRIRES